jgi:hypothetical protein
MSEPGHALVNLREGRAALERARQLGEIRELKRIGDLATAAKRFAEAQGLSEEAKRYAAEMELDAKRYLGEVLAVQPKNGGGRPETGRDVRPVSEVVPPPTLRDLGITKDESSQAQRLARIPEEDYQHFKHSSRADELNTHQALQIEREINKANVAPIIDAAERDRRLRRVRALKTIAEAEGAGAFLHAHVDDVVDAAQHDDAQRHATDLYESARLLNLVADLIGETQLRRVK